MSVFSMLLPYSAEVGVVGGEIVCILDIRTRGPVAFDAVVE